MKSQRMSLINCLDNPHPYPNFAVLTPLVNATTGIKSAIGTGQIFINDFLHRTTET